MTEDPLSGALGLALLRKAWFNFDIVCAAALLVTGVVTLVI